MGTVANLAVRISANAKDFEDKVAQMGQTMNTAQGSFGSLGAVAVGVFSAIGAAVAAVNIERIGAWGSLIVDFSNRLDISAEAVQRFKFAAEQGGSSLQTVARAMEMINRNVATGDKGFVQTLERMGVSFTQLKNVDPEQRFIMLARALQEVEDPALKDAYAFELMGRAGQEIQQILPEFIQKLSEAPVATENAAKSADRLGDAWDHMTASGEVFLGTFGGGILAGVMEGIATAIDAATEGLDMLGRYLASVTTGAPSATQAIGDDGLAAALKIAEDRAKGLNDSGLKPLNVGMAEQAQLTRDLAAKKRDTNKAHEEAARAIEREEAAYRKYLNEVGVRLMEADKAQMDYYRHMGEGMLYMLQNTPKALLTTNLPTELLMGLPEQIESNLAPAVERVATLWDGLWEHMRTSASDTFASMIFGVTGFKDGFISIWQSLKQGLMDIVGDIIHNVLGGLMKGIGSLLSGGSFGAGFGGVLGNIGSMLGLGGLGGGGAAAGATGAGGAAAGGGGGGLGGLFTNPWTAVAGGVAALVAGIWKGGLFRGGEEALKVNPARDEFFRTFQDKFGLDQQGSLATALMEAGLGGDMADRLIKRVYEADTMKEFEAATAAVNKALEEGAQKAATDSATLGTTSAQSSMAVTGLATAIQGLTDTALASAASVAAWVMPAQEQRIYDQGSNTGIMASQAGAVILDENGNVVTGGQGDGTIGGLSIPSSNYGGVVSPQDMGGTVPIVNLYGGTFIGNSQEFEDAVAAAYNSALEGGGQTYNKARIIVGQMVG